MGFAKINVLQMPQLIVFVEQIKTSALQELIIALVSMEREVA
jgi:hypothetical protein